MTTVRDALRNEQGIEMLEYVVVAAAIVAIVAVVYPATLVVDLQNAMAALGASVLAIAG